MSDENSVPPPSRPFPMPPGFSNRTGQYQAQSSKATVQAQAPANGERLGLSDDEFLGICKAHLRKDQMLDAQLLSWVSHYMGHRNAAQAARDVGLTTGQGQYLRNRPEIHALIETLTTKLVRKYGYDEHEIVERVKEISEFDPVVFENPDGSYKTSLKEIPPESRRAIKKFEVKNIIEDDPNGMPRVRGQIIKVEMWDKMEAHRLLAREKNTFKQTTTVTHDVTTNMRSALLGAAERAEQRALVGARDVSASAPQTTDIEVKSEPE